jgi:hypothetical protein
MHFPESSIENLRGLGYSKVQACFLYLVATHSGYFSTRQYLEFARAKSGEKSTAFTQKVLGQGHATAHLLLRNGRIYHLLSRLVCRAIGRENLQNRRQHSPEHIRTKLAILDFVLAHLDYRYLETVTEKVDYFCRQLDIRRALLPSKRYTGAIRENTTDRYFVDNFPLFFSSDPPSPAVVTFSFVDPGLMSLASFKTHLLAYAGLFSAVPALHLAYIATRPTHFEAAEKLFLAMTKRMSSGDAGQEILRYFAARKAWETRQYAKLNAEDVEFLKSAQTRFNNPLTDTRYHQWTENHVSSDEVRKEFLDLSPKARVRFSAELVDGQAALFEPKTPVRNQRILETRMTKS